MNILIVTNSKYIPYAKLLLHSLFSQHPDSVTIFLFHRDLSAQNISELEALVSAYPKKQLLCTCLSPELTVQLKATDKLPIETYFRIIALKLLPPELDRILYLDVDMIVKKPLDALYQTPFDGNAAIACPDIYGYVFGATQESEK